MPLTVGDIWWVFPIGITALALGAIAIAMIPGIRERRRSRRLRRVVPLRGWSFTESEPALVERWLHGPFASGVRHRALHVITGTADNQPFIAFDLRRSIAVRNGRKIAYTQVFAIRLPLALPTLRMTKVSSGNVVTHALNGGDLLDWPTEPASPMDSEAFNNAWEIRGSPGLYLHSFLHPQMMERLLQPDAREVLVTVEGSDLHIATPDRLVTFPEFDRYIALLRDIRDLIPAQVWSDYGREDASEPVPRF
ncbi:MAG: hypothetical protein ACK5H2_09460 [Beutenbergiaceae bacterium]